MSFHLCRRFVSTKGRRLRSCGRVAVFIVGAFGSCIRITRSTGSAFLVLVCAFLFAWREWLVEFSVDQEVSEDPAGAPGNTVSPALDSRGILFIDEDAAASNELVALAIVGATRHM